MPILFRLHDEERKAREVMKKYGLAFARKRSQMDQMIWWIVKKDYGSLGTLCNKDEEFNKAFVLLSYTYNYRVTGMALADDLTEDDDHVMFCDVDRPSKLP